jgi:hypothetical protein
MISEIFLLPTIARPYPGKEKSRNNLKKRIFCHMLYCTVYEAAAMPAPVLNKHPR